MIFCDVGNIASHIYNSSVGVYLLWYLLVSDIASDTPMSHYIYSL